MPETILSEMLPAAVPIPTFAVPLVHFLPLYVQRFRVDKQQSGNPPFRTEQKQPLQQNAETFPSMCKDHFTTILLVFFSGPCFAKCLIFKYCIR